MAREGNEIEQAVARTVRDSLEKLQRSTEELNQAVNDLVAACASTRPSNTLPPMMRAQTAAASLSASLEVLSRFVAGSLQMSVRPMAESFPETMPEPQAAVERRPPAARPTPPAPPVSARPQVVPVAQPAPQRVPAPPSVPQPTVVPQPIPVPPPVSAPQPAPVAQAPAVQQPAPVPPPVQHISPVPPPANLVQNPAPVQHAAPVAQPMPTPVAQPMPVPTIAPTVEAIPASNTVEPVEMELPVLPLEELMPTPPPGPMAALMPASIPIPVVEELPRITAFDVMALPVEEQELHRRANRVAKVSMQDIKLLRPNDVKLGKEQKDLCVRLRDDIEKAHKEYDRRFQSILGHPVDYFYDWMVEILGDGNPETLGKYPYPSPALRH